MINIKMQKMNQQLIKIVNTILRIKDLNNNKRNGIKYEIEFLKITIIKL